MATKLIGLCVTCGIGWIVVSKVIGLFSHVTSEIQAAIGG